MGKFEELEKLQKLKDNGTITEEEFKNEKQRILNEDVNSNLQNANVNEQIVAKYTEKTKAEKKEVNKKSIIRYILIFVIILTICLAPVLITIISTNIKEAKEAKLKVTVPNLIGKTYNQAQKELSDIGLEVKKMNGSSDDENAIVIEQERKEGYTMKKGDTFQIKVLTQEEIEKNKQEQKKKDEESTTIMKTCSEFSTIVEARNEGSVKYVYSTYYGETKNSGKVYKLKYKTSSGTTYYYQLVSFSSDYKEVRKSTKLFAFYEINGEERGQTQEMQYAYKTTFGE